MHPRVVTWQSPRGNTVNLTQRQEQMFRDANTWPRNAVGEQYCQVSYGLHSAEPTWTDAEVADIIRREQTQIDATCEE